MFVPVWFTHAWSTGEGDLLGAYLHCTATTPFETVCKQFINGSVPFGYSLNSGFDTGNDSWFSSGAWQVGTPVQKMPAGTGALWVGESRGPRGLRCHFLLGLALWEEEKKNPFALVKRLRRKERTIGGHTLLQIQTYSAKICMRGWRTSFQSRWCHTANSSVTAQMALNKLPTSRKKRRHRMQPDYTVKLKTHLTKRQYY